MIKSGIYQWRNIINNKVYIGSAINLASRKQTHLSSVRNNNHHSRHFQQAWNKYGESNFVFEILEYLEQKQDESNKHFEKRLCKELEQSYLDKYGAQEYIKKESNAFIESTYNLCPIAGSSYGRVLVKPVWNKGLKNYISKETKIKMSIKRRARIFSEETRDKMSKSIREAKQTEAHKVKWQNYLSSRELKTCVHCGKQSYDSRNMIQWHGDACKLNPNLSQAIIDKRKLHSKRLSEANKRQQLLICPHCNYKNTNKGYMVVKHFDKCKHKVIQ